MIRLKNEKENVINSFLSDYLNVILYNVIKRIPGAVEYSTLYSTKINLQNKCESPKLLTCYPEKIKLLSNGKKLWISNILCIISFTMNIFLSLRYLLP